MNRLNRLQTIVRTMCRYKNLKMKDIAEKMGITPSTLSQNLSNDNPRESSMNRYADIFGVPRDMFIEYYHNPDGYELDINRGNLLIKSKTLTSPKANMKNIEKIKAIRHQINLFGGVVISFRKTSSILGFGKYDYFMLADITADGFIIGENNDGVMVKMPLEWLSENYLYQIYLSYINLCKEQLSESAYKEIEKIVGE